MKSSFSWTKVIPRRHLEMSLTPSSSNTDKEHSGAKTLSIEIEPSYPLIMATIQFFRAQKKPRQSLELCRLGLNYFPGDLGLRIGSALAYLDLSEKDKAWMEIKAVSQELNQLAPLLESIPKHFQLNEPNNLSEWLGQLSQILSKYPEEGPEKKQESLASPIFPKEELKSAPDTPVVENSAQRDPETKIYSQMLHKEISLSSTGNNKSEAETVREAFGDSKVLSTLTNWLSQLKGNKL